MSKVQKKREGFVKKLSTIVCVTYLEVYNETIKDLLTSEDRVLELREDGRQG